MSSCDIGNPAYRQTVDVALDKKIFVVQPEYFDGDEKTSEGFFITGTYTFFSLKGETIIEEYDYKAIKEHSFTDEELDCHVQSYITDLVGRCHFNCKRKIYRV